MAHWSEPSLTSVVRWQRKRNLTVNVCITEEYIVSLCNFYDDVVIQKKKERNMIKYIIRTLWILLVLGMVVVVGLFYAIVMNVQYMVIISIWKH